MRDPTASPLFSPFDYEQPFPLPPIEPIHFPFVLYAVYQ